MDTEKMNDFKNQLNSISGYSQAELRINQLLDAESFSETGAYVADSGVITGSGTIEGRLVYVYSQYGTVNKKHGDKIKNIYAQALNMGAPVIGLLDSKGMEIESGLESFEAYGIIFQTMSDASGVIPQISAVLGDCLGTSSVIAGLSDFVFMENEKGRLYMLSPNTYEEANAKTYEALSSGKYHFETAGSVHFLAEGEIQCLTEVKTLLSYLPSNNLDETPILMFNDDINRTDEKISSYVPKGNKEADMAAVLKSIADNGEYIEFSAGYGASIVTALVRFNGFAAGVIANNGSLSNAGIKKAVKFIAFCDAFNMPIINITDANGYNVCKEGNKALIASASSLVYAYANATVPKINIIVRNAVGSAYLLMNSKFAGADLVYAWPEAGISVLDKANAKKVLGIDIENDPVAAGSAGHIDNIIEPSLTRKTIITAIETLQSKRVFKHSKKHGTIVF